MSSFQAGTGTAGNLGKGIPIRCNVQQKRYVCVSAETVSMVIGYRADNEKSSLFQAGTGIARNLGKGIPIQCNVQQKRYVCVSAETVSVVTV